MPEDTNIARISCTVSKDKVVDALVLTFTPYREINAMFTGIAPTGKHVEMPVVIIITKMLWIKPSLLLLLQSTI
jgi:carboxymethylenebutenolidase